MAAGVLACWHAGLLACWLAGWLLLAGWLAWLLAASCLAAWLPGYCCLSYNASKLIDCCRKRSQHKLRDALLASGLLTPLMVLIGQLRAKCMFTSEPGDSHINAVHRHGMIVQLVCMHHTQGTWWHGGTLCTGSLYERSPRQ